MQPLINRLIKICLGLICLAPLMGSAQTLKLDEAIKLGIDNSRQLAVSASKIAVAGTRIDQAEAGKLPQVTASLAYNRLSNNVDPFRINVPGGPEGGVVVSPVLLNQQFNRISVNEVIYNGNRVQNTIKGAQLQEQAARLDYAKDREDVKYSIIQAYYQLYKMNASQRLLEENLRLLDENIRDVENSVKSGIAVENDVLRIKLQRSNTELSLIDVKNGINVATFNLNTLIGRPTEQPIIVDTTLTFEGNKLLPREDYFTQAAANRNDVKANEIRKLAAQNNIAIAKSAMFPTLSAGGTVFLDNPNQRVVPAKSFYKQTWQIGISLNYNLTGAYTAKRQMAEAQALTDQVSAVQNQLGDAIRIEVNQAYSGVNQALGRIGVAKIAVKQSAENYRVTNNRFKAGLATLTDLLIANVAQLQNQINLLSLRVDAELALYRLRKSIEQ
jgi:outer membrane protein TolC